MNARLNDNARIFQLNSRVQNLSVHISKEQALIFSALRDAVNKNPENEGKIRAKFSAEVDSLEAWNEYLKACIQNEFSSLPEHDPELEMPDGDCLPRCKKMLIESLRDELGDADPLFDLMAEFLGAAMMMSLCTRGDLTDRREALIKEVRVRLKPPAEKRVGGMVKTKKPAPGRKGGSKDDDDET